MHRSLRPGVCYFYLAVIVVQFILLYFSFLFRLFLRQDEIDSSFARSRSSDAIRKVSQSSTSTVDKILMEDWYMWRRSRSLSDTQRTLDEAIRNLEQYMDEELTFDNRHERYSSNDSAMGESEAVLSPPPSASSEPSTLCRNRPVFDSMDSAFSNNSSPTNSSDGVNVFEPVHNHTRMSSGISGISGVSGVSSVSPIPGSDSPELADSPQLGRKGPLCSSLPTISTLSPDVHYLPPRPPPSSTKSTRTNPGKPKSKKKPEKIRKGKQSPVTTSRTYFPNQSPILNSKDVSFESVTPLDTDHTPTESYTNISTPGVAVGKLNFADEGTVI